MTVREFRQKRMNKARSIDSRGGGVEVADTTLSIIVFYFL
jgi:hypothetical protein